MSPDIPAVLGGVSERLPAMVVELREAQARGADPVLVTGAVQSNLVRVAAAAARRLGIGYAPSTWARRARSSACRRSPSAPPPDRDRLPALAPRRARGQCFSGQLPGLAAAAPMYATTIALNVALIHVTSKSALKYLAAASPNRLKRER